VEEMIKQIEISCKNMQMSDLSKVFKLDDIFTFLPTISGIVRVKNAESLTRIAS